MRWSKVETNYEMAINRLGRSSRALNKAIGRKNPLYFYELRNVKRYFILYKF